ncbi:restriction endonuclease subunit S [Enterococcus faecalis]|uniref:restriction endonuclease subunit S n=4 Tax=Enterococcus faecalis TaxID=1351 RepID=UPI00115E9ED4|nr:restriction endonuclease subunit S [Enterococcus faecalis]EGO7586315.1 restriction endonuclease subunit S [Enterococcus faecalis]EGO8700201.1 restriction endonuclease subunit S [Enterococcus faecalis]EKE4882171.1 restriction endonuclease subunit S [Enterococcus faecalis]UQF33154.1 restriction endonuclease subunit S [Enterococcus faecalis]
MRDEMKKVPRLRFRGFQEDWELCKLGDVADHFEYGLNASAIEYDGKNKYLRITDIDDSSRKFIQNKLTSPNINVEEASNYILTVGDILFARTGASVGKTYRYDIKDGKVYFAGFLIRARIKDSFDSEFVYWTTLTDRYNTFIKIMSQRSGQPGINAKEYSSFNILIPNIKEQQKIGAFLKKIDDTIALHQRKLDQLKELKKAYLKAMFVSMNTKNNKVPKLRFTDFEGDWEQRKLGNISKMYQPQTITGTELLPSGYPVFGANGYIGFYSEMNHENDQVTISARGEGTGTINYVNGPVWITGNSMVINVNDFDINKRFLHANLSSNSLKKYITGGAQPQLTRDILTSVPIKLPNIFEQNKIGLFFKQLDETVNLHQNKLTQLKSLKKAYLQNMFI